MTTLYDNGKLFTADPARPWASAMAVENGDIVWVGDDPFGDWAFPGNETAERIDLGENLLLPVLLIPTCIWWGMAGFWGRFL